MGDIKGKARTDKFKHQIVLQNMSYGISQGGQWEEQDKLSGRITNFSDLSCVKLMDVASPALATACALKTQYNDAVISVTSGTKDAYYKLTLEKVIVTSISTSISAGESEPSESFTHQLPQRHLGIRHRQRRLRSGQERQGVDGT